MGRALPGETWRRVCFDVPEPVRVQLERTLELARLSGAGSRVEALEFVMVLAEQALLEPHAEWAARCTTDEARFRLDVLTRDGWRCRICGTSRTLTCHHVIPRSECRMAGRLDLLVDPRNGATLCARCHDAVQPVWQQYVERLSNDNAPAAEG